METTVDNTPLYLEYQRLEEKGTKLEELWEVWEIIERIGERQCEILNSLMIQ